jgi:uncharacterized protein YkwD
MLAGNTLPAAAAQADEQKHQAFANWLSGLTVTRTAPGELGESPYQPPATLTAGELKAHADTLYELVNREREQVGLAPLERDSLLDEAAMIRAAEVKAVHNAGGAGHTRPDGTSFQTLLDEMGVNGKRCGENITCGKPAPQDAMSAWMQSEGHRGNILRESYGRIGIGVYQRPDGKLDWIQIFILK